MLNRGGWVWGKITVPFQEAPEYYSYWCLVALLEHTARTQTRDDVVVPVALALKTVSTFFKLQRQPKDEYGFPVHAYGADALMTSQAVALDVVLANDPAAAAEEVDHALNEERRQQSRA